MFENIDRITIYHVRKSYYKIRKNEEVNRFGDSLNESLRMRVYGLAPSKETK